MLIVNRFQTNTTCVCKVLARPYVRILLHACVQLGENLRHRPHDSGMRVALVSPELEVLLWILIDPEIVPDERRLQPQVSSC